MGTVFALRRTWEPPYVVTLGRFLNFPSFSFLICKVELIRASRGAGLSEKRTHGVGGSRSSAGVAVRRVG